MNIIDNDVNEIELNVRQREFAVTNGDNQAVILCTGNIGPCVAFYGRHNKKKVAFMSHVDLNIRGYKNLAAKLKELTNDDLEGFSLYATTNYTITLRVIFLIFSIVWLMFFPEKLFALLMFVGTLSLGFGSLALVYFFSISHFTRPQFKLLTPCQLFGKVSVSINSESDEEPRLTKEIPKLKKDNKEKFGPRHRWCDGQREVNLAGAELQE
jgi:hypothetical protein